LPWLHLRGERTRLSIAPMGAHGLGIAGSF
jgi:hypothetical protein